MKLLGPRHRTGSREKLWGSDPEGLMGPFKNIKKKNLANKISLNLLGSRHRTGIREKLWGFDPEGLVGPFKNKKKKSWKQFY